MNNTTLVAISQSLIFKDVDIEELKKLLFKQHHSTQRIKKGKKIDIDTVNFDKLIIVIEGNIRVDKSTYSQFQPISFECLFSSKRELPEPPVALEDSIIFLIDREILISCCLQSRLILENTLQLLSEKPY